MRDLIVLRHGETDGNARGVAQGRAELPLTDDGREQAAAAGRLIARLAWAPERIVSSPLRRCVETTAIVLPLLGAADDPLSVEFRDEFMEIDVGDAEGKPISHLEFSDGFAQYGGESREQLFARVQAGLDSLGGGETILLVTHGGVFKAILSHLMGFEGRYWLGLRTGTCMRLQQHGAQYSLTHFLHPAELTGQR